MVPAACIPFSSVCGEDGGTGWPGQWRVRSGYPAAVRVLLDGQVEVQYGFVQLSAVEADWPDLVEARGGQRGGLCGAAFPEALAMVTGMHTGAVPFRVELWENEPPLADEWEDVVEVSFAPAQTEYVLGGFDDFRHVALPRQITYRARYCARGMDAGAAHEPRAPDGPEVDRYLLALWPAEMAPDLVVRETSAVARYWHEVARTTPAPPSPDERAAAAAAAARHRRERDAAARAEDERRHQAWLWGEASPAVRALGEDVAQLARADLATAELIAAQPQQRQREMAVWVCRRLCALCPDAGVDWEAALRALAAGEPLPPPFDDEASAWESVLPDPTIVVTQGWFGYEPRHVEPGPIDPRAAALAAVLAAAQPDPGVGACLALDQARLARSPDGSRVGADIVAAFRSRFAPPAAR